MADKTTDGSAVNPDDDYQILRAVTPRPSTGPSPGRPTPRSTPWCPPVHRRPHRPHAYVSFTCLRTVGRALASRSGGPDPALAHCQALADPWAEQSCGGGVFSQLVVEETAGSPAADPHRDDPVWPCDQVGDTFQTPCHLLSISRILWPNGGDVPAAFRTCDHLAGTFQTTCYQSLARDISSPGSPEPSAILEACGSAGASGRARASTERLGRWCSHPDRPRPRRSVRTPPWPRAPHATPSGSRH
jgi:hypothetical protein